MRLNFGDHLLPFCFVANVMAQKQSAIATGFGQGLTRWHINVTKRHKGTFFEQQLDGFFADATGTTGDQCNFVVDASHFNSFLKRSNRTTAKPVAARTHKVPRCPNKPLAHKAIRTAAQLMQMATTRSLMLGKRAATKPPTNMPKAPNNM